MNQNRPYLLAQCMFSVSFRHRSSHISQHMKLKRKSEDVPGLTLLTPNRIGMNNVNET